MRFFLTTICIIVKLIVVATETEQTSSTNSSLANSTTPESPIQDQCFYQKLSECPNVESGECPCKRMSYGNSRETNAVLCCNLDHITLEHGLACANFPVNISYVHIRNSTLDTFNASEVRWRMLKSLAITDGKVNRVRGKFLMMSPTVCLNLSNNGLLEVDNNSLTRLVQLTTLDLSYNNLTHLPTLNTMNGRDFWLDISGTNTLWCHDIYQYINKTGDKQINFSRENETVCSASKTWHWFNSTEQVPLQQVRHLSLLHLQCPKGENWHCTCRVTRIDIKTGEQPSLAVEVDCSNMQLTELPEKLPPNTIALNVSYNNITVLDDISTNPSYGDIREFYADHNNIPSINKLEGSKFLDKYAMLSLRFNKIKSLPTYILAPSTQDKNFANRIVKLGGNELQCDCNTAKFVKVWLQTRIWDPDEVLCENVKEKVIDLEPTKMCVNSGDWTDYIYYIIALEILSLICIVTKVSYDYWIFKSAGYLPWPANKMPKLPCDWLCET